ncbi:hypothetical protein JXA63_03840 [Candidatus Woesebacteria bacterium]|nr:hypothetical protein [Candidatus Woesebacteria bacterium]
MTSRPKVLIIFIFIGVFFTTFVKPVFAQSTETQWGGMYVPISAMTQYSMEAYTSGSLRNANEILSELQSARAAGKSVIITVGSVAECNHMLNNLYQYQSAVNYFNGILTSSLRSQLQPYVNDGTLLALRFYDEVQNCGCCSGYRYTMENCGRGYHEIRNDIDSLPIGTDSQPGFADMLHQVIRSNGGLPSNLPIGSTTSLSYMKLVKDRIDLLRSREGLSPLGSKMVMGASGFLVSGQASSFISCMETYMSDLTDELMVFVYPGCEDVSTNYLFWDNYVQLCGWGKIDVLNPWSWSSGSPNFQVLLEDLANGGVSNGTRTITLLGVQNACGTEFQRPTLTPTPRPTNTPPQPLNCVDSDAEEAPNDIFIKGNVTYTNEVGTQSVLYDECNGSNTQVNEKWCYESPEGSGSYVPGTLVYDCEHGCNDGACISATPTPGCVRSNGDANGDGRAALYDYAVWANYFAPFVRNYGGVSVGDFNCDNYVDLTDYAIWANYFTPI